MRTSVFHHHINRSLAALLGMSLYVYMTPSVFAVHDTDTFQLDGNAQEAVHPAGFLGDDWDTLYNGGANDGGIGSSTAFTGIDSDKNGEDDVFTGGGSKSPNDVGQWLYKNSPPPPDKDNITHAYAANYIVGGKQVVYFGADLFDVNGDAELAFWFLQQQITKNPITGNSGTFTGAHTLHDPYIAVKFSNGGTVANIAVYEWDPTCTKPPGGAIPGAGDCAADNIRTLIPLGPATCSVGTTGDVACAISNPTASVPSPWPYTPKSGPANSFPPTAFFEGGINIFDVLGQNLCFASFMATTGASTSFTATAKDFVLGEFNVCAVAATKTCANDDETDDAPTAITYDLRGCAINDGAGNINITELKNTITSTASTADDDYTPSDLKWFDPGQVDDGSGGLRDFDPDTDCNDKNLLKQAVDNGTEVTDLSSSDLGPGEALVYQFSETTASNAATDTVSIDAEGTDGSPIDADTASATCPLRTFNADFTVTKQCAADLEDAGSNVVVKINVQGQVCNLGEVQLTGLTLADDTDMPASGTVNFTLDPDNTHTNPDTTLAPFGQAGNCVDYAGYYYPTSIPSGDICPFSDQVEATATAPANSAGAGNTTCEIVGTTIVCTADSNSATCNLRAVDEDNDCATGPLSPLPE